MSVNILSAVETRCTTNPQQIAVMELPVEGYRVESAFFHAREGLMFMLVKLNLRAGGRKTISNISKLLELPVHGTVSFTCLPVVSKLSVIREVAAEMRALAAGTAGCLQCLELMEMLEISWNIVEPPGKFYY